MQNERYALTKTRQGLSLQWVREPLPRPEAGKARVKFSAAGKVQGKLVPMCQR
jgi:hypothetical protein